MMVTSDQMRALEATALENGWTEEALMEAAGRGVAEAVQAAFPRPAAVVIFAGKGHNAGDAWVAARYWLDRGWTVVVRGCFPSMEWRPLTLAKWALIADRVAGEVPATGRLLLVDALLGLGAGGALRSPIREACGEINALRRARHAVTVAMDGPTGVDLDTGGADPEAVVADFTATIAVAKRGLLADGALACTGRLAVVSLPVLAPRLDWAGAGAGVVLTPEVVRSWLPAPAPFDFHKGQAGRVLVIAGSLGMLGAARMAAAAAVHGGAGLVTVAVSESIHDAAAASMAPEVMVQVYRDWSELSAVAADVLAVGPGLGLSADNGLVEWLAADHRAAVMDADALNAMARARRSGGRAAVRAEEALVRDRCLLTPHPGEMKRLLEAWQPDLLGASRSAQAQGFADAQRVTLLLKGGRTVVAAPERPLAYNTTGHPGMASGGMGDVLTGLSAALMARGLPSREAGGVGSWLLGRAAELALREGEESPDSLRATVVLSHLGRAFTALRYGII
jgi:NAD(P)H-hydrate epimerase